MENIVTKEQLVKKFCFRFQTPVSKLQRIQQTMETKVDKEDPTDLLPKVTAEKMTQSLLRGCQLDLYYKVNKPLSKDFCQWVYGQFLTIFGLKQLSELATLLSSFLVLLLQTFHSNQVFMRGMCKQVSRQVFTLKKKKE